MVQQQRRGPPQRGGRGRDDRSGDDFIEKVVRINRVSKVVKGGRRFSFTSLVIVGDGKGRVGMGIGRANEVPDSIRKGATVARWEMQQIPLREGTIPHPITVSYGAARVMLKPAGPGTGVIAGGGVRAVMEAAGVRNVLSKSLGSNNVVNVVRATMSALSQLRDPRAARRERLQLAGKLPPEPSATESDAAPTTTPDAATPAAADASPAAAVATPDAAPAATEGA